MQEEEPKICEIHSADCFRDTCRLDEMSSVPGSRTTEPGKGTGRLGWLDGEEFVKIFWPSSIVQSCRLAMGLYLGFLAN